MTWINTQFSNSSGYDLFWGTSLHWYAGLRPDQMDAMHAAWPNKPLLATEACICPNVQLDDWGRGEQYCATSSATSTTGRWGGLTGTFCSTRRAAPLTSAQHTHSSCCEEKG